MRRSALLALAALSLGMARRPPAREAKTMTESWEGPFCSVARPGHRVLGDGDAWRALWKEAFALEAPPADFSRSVAVAVFLGPRNTGGYSVEFLEPVSGRQSFVVRYRERKPSPSGFVIEAFTQPYAIRLFPKTGVPVTVQEAR